MHPTTTTSDANAVLRNGHLAVLGSALTDVDRMLQRELQNDAAFVDELLGYVASLGGKRMRPALLLLSAKAVGEISESHIVLSTVIEMIHIATLIHDDILDDADTRRHRPTVNRRWNSESSVLLGDYLFTHSFYLASTLDTTYACRTIGRATNKVCEGELRQVGQRGNFALTEEDYLEIVRGKTAELCACATHLGGYYAGATPDQCSRLEAFGLDLGIAFQIADDLLDLTGEEANTGKSLGTDLEKQKTTLPIIHLLRTASRSDRARALQLLAETAGDPSREELLVLLERYQSVEYARSLAAQYAASAIAELRDFPASPARDTLRFLAEFSVSRSR